MEGTTLSLFPFWGNNCSCLQKILVLVFLSIVCAIKYLEIRFTGLNGGEFLFLPSMRFMEKFQCLWDHCFHSLIANRKDTNVSLEFLPGKWQTHYKY